MKGQAASIVSQLAVAFVAIGIVVFLYFLFYGRYLDVQIIVESNEVQRRAINVAQVLMSSKDIVWSESVGGTERFYRGVFDEAKLDSQMVPSAGYNHDQLLDSGALKKYVVYPGMVTAITIRSKDMSDAWFAMFTDYSNPDSAGFFSCVANSLDLSFFVEYDACTKTYQGSGTFEKTFPVLLVDYAGTLHPASMTVAMTSATTAGRVGESAGGSVGGLE